MKLYIINTILFLKQSFISIHLYNTLMDYIVIILLLKCIQN